MPNPLELNSVLTLLSTLLPRSTTSPLPQPTDVIAALVHAIHTALDFRLVNQRQPPSTLPTTSNANSEDDAIDDGASETETAVDNEEDTSQAEGSLGSEWNGRGEDSYSFEYRHAQSSLTFRVRVGRMGGRVQIDATAEVS